MLELFYNSTVFLSVKDLETGRLGVKASFHESLAVFLDKALFPPAAGPPGMPHPLPTLCTLVEIDPGKWLARFPFSNNKYDTGCLSFEFKWLGLKLLPALFPQHTYPKFGDLVYAWS